MEPIIVHKDVGKSFVQRRKQESFWDQLLWMLSEGHVVPVVGEELLQIPGESDETTLYQALAVRYASHFNIALEKDLSSTVRNHPDFQTHPSEIYWTLTSVYDELNPSIPKPLRALAKIRDFNLFVSTTFDNLLERALNEVRFNGEKRTEVITYVPNNVPKEDDISKKLSSGYPVIFQIFGDYRNRSDYALTEGDMVDYMHKLQTREYRPERIFRELYEHSLLWIGNCFPDWLARIFLRTTRNTKLNDDNVPKQYFVDKIVSSDPALQFFLKNFTKHTKLVKDITPADFVIELYNKYDEKFNGQEAGTSHTEVSVKGRKGNAVFISYCATDASGNPTRDKDIAHAIRKALTDRGIEVWIDTYQLVGGDDWKREITQYIETCSLFIPLVSKTTESREEGFFRREWILVVDRLRNLWSGRQFLLPVVIDNINPYEAKVPEEFKQIQFTHILDRVLPEQFLDRVQALYEKTIQEANKR